MSTAIATIDRQTGKALTSGYKQTFVAGGRIQERRRSSKYTVITVNSVGGRITSQQAGQYARTMNAYNNAGRVGAAKSLNRRANLYNQRTGLNHKVVVNKTTIKLNRKTGNYRVKTRQLGGSVLQTKGQIRASNRARSGRGNIGGGGKRGYYARDSKGRFR
jgi:hypothetical protein